MSRHRRDPTPRMVRSSIAVFLVITYPPQQVANDQRDGYPFVPRLPSQPIEETGIDNRSDSRVFCRHDAPLGGSVAQVQHQENLSGPDALTATRSCRQILSWLPYLDRPSSTFPVDHPRNQERPSRTARAILDVVLRRPPELSNDADNVKGGNARRHRQQSSLGRNRRPPRSFFSRARLSRSRLCCP
jgi:hypothetical protein